jgi:hypothetical protein
MIGAPDINVRLLYTGVFVVDPPHLPGDAIVGLAGHCPLDHP